MLTDADLGRFAFSMLDNVSANAIRHSFLWPWVPETSAARVLEVLASEHSEHDRRKALVEAEGLLDASSRIGVRILPITSVEYPSPLRAIGTAPPFIHVAGSFPDDWTLAVAVVGTRDPEASALDATDRVVRSLALERTCTVVSGLALGIDTAAHESALREGLQTVAVLGHGLDTMYPKENRHLAQRIIEKDGCLLSEYPVGTKAARPRLVARDRLQSALASAVIVIQAGVDGGTLHTARFALRQRKRLFVLEPPAASTPGWGGNVFLTDPNPERLKLRPKIRFPTWPLPYGRRVALRDLREAARAMLTIP